MKIQEFDYRKAVQALNFFAQKAGGKITKLNALKLVYLADRFHLRKYGRPIFGDVYWAMEYGPVASSVADIFEFSGAEEEIEYAGTYLSPVKGEGKPTVQSAGEVDLKVFSNSDIEALEFSQSQFGKLALGQLLEECHKYPEWKKYEETLNSPLVSRKLMDYCDFFEDPGAGNNFHASPEQLDASKQIFEDQANVARMWK